MKRKSAQKNLSDQLDDYLEHKTAEELQLFAEMLMREKKRRKSKKKSK